MSIESAKAFLLRFLDELPVDVGTVTQKNSISATADFSQYTADDINTELGELENEGVIEAVPPYALRRLR